MKSDFSRKGDAVRKILEGTLSPGYSGTVCFNETLRTAEFVLDDEEWSPIALSDLQQLKEVFRCEEIEVCPDSERTSVYLSGIGRWPWEM